MNRGLLFVVSAPSGTGKTTIVGRLVELVPRLVRSRSYTSRGARVGEVDGQDYNFIERERFEGMIARGEMLEWAQVFGNLYGTGARDIEQHLAAGRDVVLVIDVQGAAQVRGRDLAAIFVFVLPPSYSTLEQRLRGRSQDSEEVIRRRLEIARREVGTAPEYDYVVVNDELDACVERVKSIVVAERARWRPDNPAIVDVMRSFELSSDAAPTASSPASRPAREAGGDA